jgi:sulfofructose kinase
VQFPFKIQQNKKFDAVGFGLNAVDHLVVVSEYPAFDTKTRLLNHLQSAGGQTASAIVGLQRLGMKTAYAGRFGSDSEGHFGLQTLRDEGVNVERCEMIDGARTQIAFILIDVRSGERTIIWDRDDRLAYRPDEAPLEIASIGKLLHIDAHDPPACTRMTIAAQESGTIVSGDFDNVYEGVEDLLPHMDLLISSKDFPRKLLGIQGEREALVEMKARFGFPVIGMTLGERGAIAYCDGTFFESRAFAVPGGCHDTTGAGDAFHAGLIYGVLNGDSIEETLKLANATAALKCRALGARTALPKKEELFDLIANGTRL